MPNKNEIFKDIPAAAGKDIKKAAQPEWINPMLATLTEERFSRTDWIYEPKLDGERCLAFKKAGEVRLMSRNRKLINGSYPELVTAIKSQSVDFIVDGEIVTFDGEVSSFQRLQHRMQMDAPDETLKKAVPVFYYIFDLLYIDGYDITHLPLLQRKKLLEETIDFKDPLRFTPHVEKEGVEYYKAACRRGWEGIIAKRAAAPYVSVRSRDWLKFKCVREQEFVIGGFTEPRGSRTGFGALLLGYYRGKDLIYAGKVGTGFDEELLGNLYKRMAAIERATPPFKGIVKERGLHWVRPELVGEVGFTEWTETGSLRHPRFMGLRRDKAARDVVREE
jgi:DNA ligase D-like protein (predicted ligase)